MAAHILIIEDSPAIADLLADILTEAGYQVTVWATRPTDLTPVIQLQPDLLLLDYMLGTAEAGPHLWQEVVTTAATARLPVLLCTAALDQITAIADQLVAYGVAVVLKPFDLDDLLMTVAGLVQG